MIKLKQCWFEYDKSIIKKHLLELDLIAMFGNGVFLEDILSLIWAHSNNINLQLIFEVGWFFSASIKNILLCFSGNENDNIAPPN